MHRTRGFLILLAISSTLVGCAAIPDSGSLPPVTDVSVQFQTGSDADGLVRTSTDICAEADSEVPDRFQKRTCPLDGGDRLLIADVNGDGLPDVVLYGNGMWGISILLNNGRGGFNVPIDVSFNAPYSSPSSKIPALADFDGDGVLDVADCSSVERTSPGSMSFKVSTYLYAGHRRYRTGETLAKLDSAGGCSAIMAVDVNGDGFPDIIVAYNSGTNYAPSFAITTFFNDGTGHFSPPHTETSASPLWEPYSGSPGFPFSGCGVGSVVAGDFDGDGIVDLVASGYCYRSVDTIGTLYLGKGDGSGHFVWTRIEDLTPGPNLQLPYTSIIAKDLNHDGAIDLSLRYSYAGYSFYYDDLNLGINDHSGGFHLSSTYAFDFQQLCNDGSGHFGGAIADMDGDGHPDSIASYYKQEGCYSGAGFFPLSIRYDVDGQPPTGRTLTWNMPEPLVSIETGDFNADGRIDIVGVARDPFRGTPASLVIYLAK